MLGRHAADDADVVDAPQPLRLAHRGELGAQHRLAGDAELLGDGGAGGDVVAGHHAHADVGALRVAHGRLGLLARRVDHADDRRQLEVGDVAQEVALGVERGRVQVADGRGHHPVALAGHADHGVVRLLLEGVVQRHGLAVGEGARGAVEHGRRRALDEAAHHALARGVGGGAERGHELVDGVERQGGQPREALAAGVDVQPGLVAEHQQGALGGIADDLAVLQLGVVGDDVREDGVVDGEGSAGRVPAPARRGRSRCPRRCSGRPRRAPRRRSPGSS